MLTFERFSVSESEPVVWSGIVGAGMKPPLTVNSYLGILVEQLASGFYAKSVYQGRDPTHSEGNVAQWLERALHKR